MWQGLFEGKGPSADQLEASQQDNQSSHSGSGVSLQVPGRVWLLGCCALPIERHVAARQGQRHAAKAREGGLCEGSDQAAHKERDAHDGCTNASPDSPQLLHTAKGLLYTFGIIKPPATPHNSRICPSGAAMGPVERA